MSILSENTDLQRAVEQINAAKPIFTPGPASLLAENISGLRPCFGRGDADYASIESEVLGTLKTLTGHREIVCLQGSATLALEMAVCNFLQGRVLIIDTGYYSKRLLDLVQRHHDGVLVSIDWQELTAHSGCYDWVLACPTETSNALKIPIDWLRQQADRLKASLMLDATASIGLESQHDLADLLAYSSCKGLFGFTGASFIAFNEAPQQEPASLYLDIQTHLQHKVTGPYHAIASLAEVLPIHSELREAVVVNKQRCLNLFAEYLVLPAEHQPLLCTGLSCDLEATDSAAVLYTPRGNAVGSVVCHLGEVHLGRKAQGDILNCLRIKQ
jgi:2-aminoethylphosphonate-pyruvate transaminase